MRRMGRRGSVGVFVTVHAGAGVKKHRGEVPLGPRRPFPFGVDRMCMAREEVAM